MKLLYKTKQEKKGEQRRLFSSLRRLNPTFCSFYALKLGVINFTLARNVKTETTAERETR